MTKKIETPTNLDVNETAPKLVIATGVIKGSIDAIPADLIKQRSSWNWDELEVGDHKEFPVEEIAKVRSAYTGFAKGTKERAPRTFVSRTVPKLDTDGKVLGKVLEVWRLADPVIAITEQPKTE